MIGAVGRVGLLGLQSGRRGRLLLYPAYVQDYLDRVTAADVSAGNTQGLELGVTDAFNTCLQAMVGDGSLGVSGNVLAQAASLVKASCAMQGARTLSGALVPLAADMPAPTNFNFVAADYNRRTGLIGNGSTKYLNTNLSNIAQPINSTSLGAYATSTPSSFSCAYLGVSSSANPGSEVHIGALTTGTVFSRLRNAARSDTAASSLTGFVGASRSASSGYTVRLQSGSTAITQTSSTATANLNYFVFGRNNAGSLDSQFNGQLNFYFIGEALDLAILDARITALSNAIQAAIAP